MGRGARSLRRAARPAAAAGRADPLQGQAEVLAGARDDMELHRLRPALVRLPLIPLEGLADYEEAAAIYRRCRRAGETIRKMTDCLIAVPVMRADAELLHNDADFDAIARHTRMKILPLDR